MSAVCTRSCETTPYASLAEETLLERLRAGDPLASEEWVRENSGRLLSVARRYLPREEDAADAVQDAFFAAYRALDTFEGTSRMSTWLHRIVVNTCLTRLRTQSRRRRAGLEEFTLAFEEDTGFPEPAAHHPETGGAELEKEELRHQVRACINRLPPEYRTVLQLRDIDEVDTEQTARQLGTTTGAVKVRLHRARQALRRLLEPLVSE